MSSREGCLRRIMALDLGARRTGVALSDETQTLAAPFETVVHSSLAGLLDRLAHIATAENVESVLVGMPLSFDGERGPQARHVASEAERIGERLQVPVVFWDERLSTVNAELLVAEVRGRRPGRGARSPRAQKQKSSRQSVDAVAAAMILQEYLDSRHEAHARRDGEGQA